MRENGFDPGYESVECLEDMHPVHCSCEMPNWLLKLEDAELEREAYHLGYGAGMSGVNARKNPFPSDFPMCQEKWKEGWKAANLETVA